MSAQDLHRASLDNAQLYKLRSIILSVTNQHEETSHGGLPCWAERENLIAWLCHSLGIQPHNLGVISERIMEYAHYHMETDAHDPS
jgi:hypothetical protein